MGSSAFLRPAFAALSPAGAGARLSVLIFHRVHARTDELFPGEPDARRFDELCGWLKDWFHVLPADEAVKRLAAGRLPRRAACITFDDGYADNHDVALPILARHGLPAAFFIATGFLEGGRMFNDTVIELVRRSPLDTLPLEGLDLGPEVPARLPLGNTAQRHAAIGTLIGAVKYLAPAERLALTQALQRRAQVDRLPDDLMMSADQVRALRRAGMQVGAHTVSHPILARLDDDDARAEIANGKAQLEAILGERVTLFAYPNGRPGTDYVERTVALAREAGFEAAFSTAWGSARADSDRFQLPRFTPWDAGGFKFGLRLVANLTRRAELLPASPGSERQRG